MSESHRWCFRCKHSQCPGCDDWCDVLLADGEFCCDGECIYAPDWVRGQLELAGFYDESVPLVERWYRTTLAFDAHRAAMYSDDDLAFGPPLPEELWETAPLPPIIVTPNERWALSIQQIRVMDAIEARKPDALRFWWMQRGRALWSVAQDRLYGPRNNH